MNLYSVDIQAVEDALGAGRHLKITFEFVDQEGTPVVDVAVYEGEQLILSSIGEYSFEDAINVLRNGV